MLTDQDRALIENYNNGTYTLESYRYPQQIVHAFKGDAAVRLYESLFNIQVPEIIPLDEALLLVSVQRTMTRAMLRRPVEERRFSRVQRLKLYAFVDGRLFGSLSTSMSKARKWIRELANEGPYDLLE
jgi:hypothetical protein